MWHINDTWRGLKIHSLYSMCANTHILSDVTWALLRFRIKFENERVSTKVKCDWDCVQSVNDYECEEELFWVNPTRFHRNTRLEFSFIFTLLTFESIMWRFTNSPIVDDSISCTSRKMKTHWHIKSILSVRFLFTTVNIWFSLWLFIVE